MSPTQETRAPLIPREDLFGNPEKAAPKVSPDGKCLAFLAPNEGVLNLWVSGDIHFILCRSITIPLPFNHYVCVIALNIHPWRCPV